MKKTMLGIFVIGLMSVNLDAGQQLSNAGSKPQAAGNEKQERLKKYISALRENRWPQRKELLLQAVVVDHINPNHLCYSVIHKIAPGQAIYTQACTALNDAALCSDADCVKQLLAYNADPRGMNCDPAQNSVVQNLDTSKFTSSSGEELTLPPTTEPCQPVVCSARTPEIVQILLTHAGVKPDEWDQYVMQGYVRALEKSVWNGTKRLIQDAVGVKNINPNDLCYNSFQQIEDGQAMGIQACTALNDAVLFDDIETVRFLLHHKADARGLNSDPSKYLVALPATINSVMTGELLNITPAPQRPVICSASSRAIAYELMRHGAEKPNDGLVSPKEVLNAHKDLQKEQSVRERLQHLLGFMSQPLRDLIFAYYESPLMLASGCIIS